MSSDAILIDRIRAGEPEAWKELIARFEGRLLAYVEARLHRRDVAEDVVQETLIGLLTSLPNYDAARPLESYLFSIAAHKLTDHLRRQGRRPALPLASASTTGNSFDPPSPARRASSLLQSAQRKHVEAEALAVAMAEILDRWRERGQWPKVQCAELLFVAGWPNKRVAEELGISEQAVANQKFDFIDRLQRSLIKQRLSEDLFPELQQPR
ncbi:MAG TPA: RNA polymerase sigma factor [Pirellulales bacterium]|jgi:RNA polymerase sigma-70 factor (ECF subfamily)|nr:RNA polymerase sigma factor [Pirellulales bacterium]